MDCHRTYEACVNVLQGVTLTDLKEAQRTTSLSPPDGPTEEGGALDERSSPGRGLTDDRGVRKTELNPKRSIIDKVSTGERRNSYRNQKSDVTSCCANSFLWFYRKLHFFLSIMVRRGTLNPG